MNDSMKNSFHEKIMLEYEKIREQNYVARLKFKKQVYFHFPRVEEIDEALNMVALDSCREILKSALSPDKVVEEMKNKIEGLVKERERILNDAGLPTNCLDETFCCDLCKDTGWNNGEKCQCYKKKLQKLILESSNIKPNKMHNFEKFNIDLYSEQVDKEYGISPKDNAKNILQTAKKYAKLKESNSRQLLLYGGTGLGKTFTSECIAKEFIKKDMSVYYTSAPKLFTIFEEYKFGRDTSENTKQILDYIANVDLLIIDDLGTEFVTQFTLAALFDIVNARITAGKSTVISTNLSFETLAETYSQRIASRFMGEYKIIQTLGEDIRKIKRARNKN